MLFTDTYRSFDLISDRPRRRVRLGYVPGIDPRPTVHVLRPGLKFGRVKQGSFNRRIVEFGERLRAGDRPALDRCTRADAR